MAKDDDAILIGGPRDGSRYAANDAGLVELEIDGLIHRYIHTSQHRQVDGAELRVYNYDGEVSPQGAQSGVEDAQDRAASPLAEANNSDTESRN
ncbi:hypothetical protein [Micromonospora foliorum]|uniref:hypothetical protein n=1 Tax=Micromonospora foliorum TaxID=2911210 RepID=UPI001EE903C1|nr:hypothetical protein [Micromonospora foliorum]MCG5438083.1 hypothetical protein [Micromonospora foliorum]